jgi:uncharacterized protein involved in exopolysaccharide biosynthesis
MTLDAAPAEDLRMDIGALLGAVWRRGLRILIVAAILAGLAYAFLVLFVPKLYESSASLLVEDRANTYTQAAGAQLATAASAITIDAMMSSQIELAKSRDTLLAVIDQLKLGSVPEFGGVSPSPITAFLALIGKSPSARSLDETALQNLNDRLTVARERDSAVITISVRSTDPQLAATIANAIAEEHVKRRAGQSLADTAESTQYLARQIEELRKKVEEADSKVANFRIDNDIFSGSNNTSLTDQQLSDIAKQVTDAQERRNTAQQRANLIRGLLKGGQPIDAVPDVRESVVIQQLMQTRANLQSDLAQRSATLLPSHPTMKALAAQVKEVDAQIADEGRRIAAGLEAQVKIESGLLDSLNDDLTRAKLSSSTATRDGVTLDSLMREAKAQRDLLDSYLLRYRDAASRTDVGSTLPDVRQITQAAPAVTPSSPNVTLVLTAVVFVSVALQVGATLFGELMSGRAVYDRNSPEAAHAMLDGDGDDEEDDEAVPAGRKRFVQEPAPPPPGSPAPVERVAVEMPSPVKAARTEAPKPRHRAAANDDLELSNLSADIAIGRAHIVLLAGVSQGRDSAIIADRLVADALQRGLSVCRIDAGSTRASEAPGITDLCAERASFGDVVHKVGEGLAEVPWGTLPSLERRSMKPVTLIEALSDIYEAVIVVTGRVGMGSSLPVFSGVEGKLVLVRRPGTPEAAVETAAADARAIGFETVQAIAVPEPEAAVA